MQIPLSLDPEKGTYVRSARIARRVLEPLSRRAPGLAAVVAERLFFTPPRPRRSSGDALLAEAERLSVRVEGRRLPVWRFGTGPAVLLLHGWGGCAAQLTSFVPALLERGASAVAFDGPGHGRHGSGRSSAPELARALAAVAEAVGGAHGVIAHSLGAAATALAMRHHGLSPRRVAFLGPAAVPPEWVAPFGALLGLTPDTLSRLRRISERRIGLDWSELDVPALAAGFEVPLLVVHDRDDAEVPFADGERIAAAWPGARLHESTGLGHKRVLRDPSVVERVAAFVAGAAPACGCRGQTLPCLACLERELYQRDSRGVRGLATSCS